MLQAGITGGIGSGKSTVCKIFEVLGVPVYYADERAKELINTQPELIRKIKALLGEDVYNSDSQIDRKRVATVVFNFPEILKEYNAIVHPAVLDDAEKWARRHQQYDYILKEAALLFEAGSYVYLDKIICVTAPLSVRIERVKQRDGATEEEIVARMNNQWPEEKKAELSDFIIYNDGTSPLIPQVLQIHEELIRLSKES